MYGTLNECRNRRRQKTDKSNNVMVMDVSYYERVVMKTIDNGPYTKLEHDPLREMINEVNDVLEKHKNILCENPKSDLRYWKVSNPSVPRLYVLLKYHKDKDPDGDYKGRPVASNVNAPSERIAKKLSKIFNSLTPPEGKSVLNGIDFASKVNGLTISRNEEIGSYDVTSLYPSIPIPYSMNLLKKWLIKNEVKSDLVEAYVDLSRVCMKQNIFQFRNSYYSQTKGTSIGNSLSSFIAELFMCDFETNMSKHPDFPRVYYRYVDDIFVIQNRRKFDLVRSAFEKHLDKIEVGAVKFTIERQVDNKLPFLNTLVEIVNGVLTIDVYRKPSSTQRLITCDSHHDIKHKMAAYHSMAHLMVNLPLDESKITKETNTIIEIGRINGYPEKMIKCIIDKHKRKKELCNFSTFYDSVRNDERKVRVGVPYYPRVTKLLKPIYREHDMELVHRSDFSLKNALGSIKDVPPDIHKSGIYNAQCDTCGRYYYGCTIRCAYVRYNEHEKSANWKNKTAIGKHIHYTNHSFNISSLRLVQEVRRPWLNELYEAIHIRKNSHLHLLNEDNGNIKSPLLSLFATKRVIDENVIDLTDDTFHLSVNDDEIFFDCE